MSREEKPQYAIPPSSEAAQAGAYSSGRTPSPSRYQIPGMRTPPSEVTPQPAGLPPIEGEPRGSQHHPASAGASIGEAASAAAAARPAPGRGRGEGGRRGRPGAPGVYHFNLPVKPIRADISIEHLEKLAAYYGLYGALLLAPGVAVLLLTLFTSIAAELVFGWALIVAGVLAGLQCVFVLGAPGAWGFLLLGLVHLGAGFLLISEPLHASIGITVVLTAWLLTQGLVKILQSVSVSSITAWPLALLSGFLSLALGFTVLALFPSQRLWLLGLLVGLDFAFTGLALMAVSLFASWATEMVSEAEEPLLAPQQGPQNV